jgi:hypothetical protein
VVIPNSVTNVGTYAFYGCTPKEVTVPGWKSGVDISSVTNLIISEGTTSVPGWEFCGCDSLISVTIPASVTSIGYGAFSACNSLTSVIFEGNAPSVSDYDFHKADSTCTAFVKRASTGWGVAIPGRWNGLYIQYIDFTPAPDSEPNPESTPDPAPIPKPEPVPMPELRDGGYEVGGDDIGTSIPEYAASVTLRAISLSVNPPSSVPKKIVPFERGESSVKVI